MDMLETCSTAEQTATEDHLLNLYILLLITMQMALVRLQTN